MLRARHPVQLLLAVLAVGLVTGSQHVPRQALVSAAVPPLPALHASTRINPDRPECPHYWDTIPMPRDGQRDKGAAAAPFVFTSGLSVSGPQSNVPEFNDCQPLIVNEGDGPFRYGPLMAVFASYRLDSLPVTPDTLRSNTQVFAAAEILDYSNVTGYDPLAIGPLFNCLYIWGTVGSLQAKMVHAGRMEPRCAEAYSPSDVPGQTLAVREIAVPGFTAADYPPVARWDWDPAGKVQYIGVRCGAEWCEVGPGNSTSPSTPGFVSSAPYGNPAGSIAERRVGAVKGWYDQQYLSMYEGGVNHPTLLRGTVIPDPKLALASPKAHPGRWYTTSHVAIERPPIGSLVKELAYYRDKFNFDPVAPHAPLARMNHILLCFGTGTECKVPRTPTASMRTSCDPSMIAPGSTTQGYWSMTTSPVRSRVMYRCVTYYQHKYVSIPPTARWRWLARDETTWRYCTSGCCEVNGN